VWQDKFWYHVVMEAEAGLRERKKQQTRQLIAEKARRLFDERGFDAVTVAQVAKAADVSEATVFNYFPTKESLFYSQMQAFEEALVNAVRQRPAGESVPSAFRRFIHNGADRLAEEDAADAILAAARVVGASPALRAREREIVADYTDVLAGLIAQETRARPGDLEPLVVAGALMAAHRAIVSHVRSEVLAGRRGRALAREARTQMKRAFDRLERGLAGYGVVVKETLPRA
jgi:AcrR family transcriptional regulator